MVKIFKILFGIDIKNEKDRAAGSWQFLAVRPFGRINSALSSKLAC